MRTLNPKYLTEVANHPDVRPWLEGSGALDLSEIVNDPANIALEFDGGGWVLRSLGGCVYEVHSLFVPEARGEKVRRYLKEALEYVFLRTDAVRLVTKIPANNAAAMYLARIARFRSWFKRGQDDYAVLSIEDWVQSSYACRQAGHAFHERLETLKRESGSNLENHPEDAAHDHAAGAAYLMCEQGNAAKGVWHYNQWAALAGYAPIQLMSVSPLMIDMGDAILSDGMEVLLCR